MHKKAQTVGGFLMGFVAVIVAIALFIAAAQQVGNSTTTSLYNTSSGSATITIPAAGVVLDLEGQELTDTPVVRNNSANTIIAAGNYTIDEGVSATTGLKTIRYTPTATANTQGAVLNITYNYGPDGYIESSGGRSMATLIVLFAALAIAVVGISLSNEGLRNIISQKMGN